MGKRVFLIVPYKMLQDERLAKMNFILKDNHKEKHYYIQVSRFVMH